jgi:hypothetical protein
MSSSDINTLGIYLARVARVFVLLLFLCVVAVVAAEPTGSAWGLLAPGLYSAYILLTS